MIQITGLTKVYRRGGPPAVLDLTFDARPGMVTALLGPEDSGKSTALRLVLELERGQGVALFDGRTYRRLRRPEREVGVLLPGPGGPEGMLAGHPGRKARSHLRMLAAAVGVPARRADELLEQTRLATVAGQRLRTFSPGMHRRLALATALLGDPGTLVLDAPTEGLSPRNVEWFHSFLRSFGVAGGTVLVTTRTPQEAAGLADRVITLDQGRMVADQPVTEFRRTRLSPEVAVRGPQMARLADLLVSQGAQVRRDGGAGLAVAGIDRTEIGELAYRHGILLHELADRVVEQPAPRATLPVASGRSGHLHLRPTPAGQAAADPTPARPGRTRPVKARSAADASMTGQAGTPPVPVAGGEQAPGPEPAGAGQAHVPQPASGTPPTGPASGGALPALALPATPASAAAATAAGASAASARPPRPARRTSPAVPEPAVPEPAVPEPAQSEPALAEPAVPEPAQSEPALAEPAVPESADPADPADLADLAETSPTVAVDRLFRDGLSSLVRADGSGAPAPAPREPRDAAADGDLQTADTVRLGRLNPRTAPAPSPIDPGPTAPTTSIPTPDHRSE
ncbi:ATP-binding cassette domain-containing protein [Kitasatospora sp. NPDC127111]|uniref:ATP-binding cassette domain-containing protein n=1 Tax=Kitasatospora sp. NPDC127111 TaxID=3345363 RepID=UPI0036311FA4